MEQRKQEQAQRAYAALELALGRSLGKDYTGTVAVELDLKQGGITAVRVVSREVR